MASAIKQQPVRDAANSSVRAEIFDQAYNLRGSDPDYILKLAEYVERIKALEAKLAPLGAWIKGGISAIVILLIVVIVLLARAH